MSMDDFTQHPLRSSRRTISTKSATTGTAVKSVMTNRNAVSVKPFNCSAVKTSTPADRTHFIQIGERASPNVRRQAPGKRSSTDAHSKKQLANPMQRQESFDAEQDTRES